MHTFAFFRSYFFWIALFNLLFPFGINSKQIKILGRGETSPLVITDDDVKHPANRRAEIKPLN